MKSVCILFVIFTVFLISGFFGCGDDKDTSTEPDINVPAELVGTWTYQSAAVNEVPVSLALVLGWQPNTVAARFTVSEDESFLYEELDSADVVQWTESGTFSVDGNNATISITNDDDGPVEPPEIFAGSWVVNDNELTLTTTLGSTTIVLTAVKEI